jgi:hypothetical protein
MYASVRKYRVTDSAQIARRIQEDFLSRVREVPGFAGYYVVGDGSGVLVTVTLADDQAGAEASADTAAGWIRENDDIAALIDGSPDVTNGEVLARA